LAVVHELALAAGGVADYLHTRVTPTHAVPRLVGLTEAQARNQVVEMGFDIQTTHSRKDATVAGQVIGQSPAPGTKLAEGGRLTLTVSDGPTLATLTDVTGKTLDEATGLLEGAGLRRGTVAQEPSELVPAGTVLSWTVAGQSLAAGQQLVKGTPVDLVVSSGPLPRTVPTVVNLPYAQAAAKLAAVQLVAARAPDAFSDTVAVGNVISASPAAGQKEPRNSTVTLVVSKGPDVVTVPDVRGQTLTQAVANLTGAGLAQGTVAGPIAGKVLLTSPQPGQVVHRNTAVNILMG
jgi:serine/threonine-protein kinase